MISPEPQHAKPQELTLSQLSPSFSRGPSIVSMWLERLDTLGADDLKTLSQFPSSVEQIVRQCPPSLPVSSYPELFTHEALKEFRSLVEADVGCCDLQMWVARADIRSASGQILKSQPVHVFSSFRYGDHEYAGSFFGSLSNTVLALGTKHPFELRKKLVEDLVGQFLALKRFHGVVIAFPQKSHTLQQSEQSSVPRSAAFDILTSPPLRFIACNIAESAGASRCKMTHQPHTYFYWPTDQVMGNNDFLRFPIAIRRGRSEQLNHLSERDGFADQERSRNEIRRQYVDVLFDVADS